MRDAVVNGAIESNPELMRRPLRERIIQLLAIRPYKKPELMSRLHRGSFVLLVFGRLLASTWLTGFRFHCLAEGLKDKDKKLIMPVLVAVGLMKDQAYHLARHIWNEVLDDWPFYTDQERQLLKR